MRTLLLAIALGSSFKIHAAIVQDTDALSVPRVDRQCIIPEGFTGIWNREGLEEVRKDLTGKYILCSPIILNSEFRPIGETKADGSIEYFQGILDGNDLSIKGLRILQPNLQQVGLFRGLHTQARVLNLRLIDSVVTGKSMVGTLAGVIQGYVRNIVVQNASIGSNESEIVGGLAGVLNSASLHDIARLKEISIRQSYIKGLHTTGGLIGKSRAGRIEESQAEAKVVSLSSAAGGLVGQYLGSKVIEADGIFDSISLSEITGGGPALGGLVGMISEDGLVDRTYSRSRLSTAGGRGGCIVGQALSSQILNSYFEPEFCQSIHAWDKVLPPLGVKEIEDYRIPISHTFDFRKVWYLDPESLKPKLRLID